MFTDVYIFTHIHTLFFVCLLVCPQLLMGMCVTPCARLRAVGARGPISVCPVRTSAEGECVWMSVGPSLGEYTAFATLPPAYMTIVWHVYVCLPRADTC